MILTCADNFFWQKIYPSKWYNSETLSEALLLVLALIAYALLGLYAWAVVSINLSIWPWGLIASVFLVAIGEALRDEGCSTWDWICGAILSLIGATQIPIVLGWLYIKALVETFVLPLLSYLLSLVG